MSKISLIAALALGGLIACSTLATAQDATKDANKSGKKGFSVEQRLGALTTKLSLTDDQKPKVKAVLDDTAKKMKDLAPEDRQTKGREIRTEETKKMKEILTADQFTKYQEMFQHGKKGAKKAEKKSE
jgi:Spy/CpxP family protein refolding chaperone